MAVELVVILEVTRAQLLQELERVEPRAEHSVEIA
jgi:hypothetical protein